MSFDAKLILAALDKHFDAVQARWDRFFAVQDQKWAKQVVPGDVPGEHHFQAPNSTDEIRTRSYLTSTELPVAAVAGRELPLAARVVNVGPFPAEQQTSDTKHMAPATSSSATTTSPPTASSAAAIDIRHGVTAASSASTRSLAPAARGADEDNTTNITPTRCLMQVHSSDIALIASPTSCGSSLGTNKHDTNVYIDLLASYDGSTQVLRYINPIAPSLSSGIVLLLVATQFHAAQNVFEWMSAQNGVMLQLLLVELIDKGPWSPLLCCQKFPTDTAQPCLRSWQSFLCDWADGQLRQPWPPPVQYEVQVDGIHLRPTPWPSFNSLAMVIQLAIVLSRMCCCSISQSMMQLHLQNINGYCLRQWPELLENALQADGFITELAVSLFQAHHDVSTELGLHFLFMGVDIITWSNTHLVSTIQKVSPATIQPLMEFLFSKARVLLSCGVKFSAKHQVVITDSPFSAKLTTLNVVMGFNSNSTKHTLIPGGFVILYQLEGKSIQWPVIQPNTSHISWIQASPLLSPSELRFYNLLHKLGAHISLLHDTCLLGASKIILLLLDATVCEKLHRFWVVVGFSETVSFEEIKINNVTSIRYMQAPWDPGGVDIKHRLEGKPNFKKGGMLVTHMDRHGPWASASRLSIGRDYKERAAQRWRASNIQNKVNLLFISFYLWKFSSDSPSLYSDLPLPRGLVPGDSRSIIIHV